MKPMLASKITDLSALRYPVLASPKFDGIRALTNGTLVSRNLKPIPNSYVREKAKGLPDNLDGELILIKDGAGPGATFSETSSAVMKRDGEPDVKYYVFDYVKDSLGKPAIDRQKDLLKVYLDFHHVSSFMVMVIQKPIYNETELLEYERECLTNGYEGIMIKSLSGMYKEGRSTETEGYLLKLKRFTDSEAVILSFEEQMHNNNVAEEDLLGHTKRSSCKDGMIPANTLGKLCVKDIESGIEFEIGTGFDAVMRNHIWKHQKLYLNKIVKYKYQSCGMKDKPRFPVFMGFRDRQDM